MNIKALSQLLSICCHRSCHDLSASHKHGGEQGFPGGGSSVQRMGRAGSWSEQEVVGLRVTFSETWGDLSPTVLEVASQAGSVQTTLSHAHKAARRGHLGVSPQSLLATEGKRQTFPSESGQRLGSSSGGLGGYSYSTLV